MSYKALYRTYRPSTFDEVAGQKSIVRTLQNALLQQKMAHAYLFSGPRGTGKTSMAKLFAKALNCDEGIGQQCNHCINCTGINDGSHPDVYEIDAASNNGVDDVRQLIENINYAPIRGRYKVYIIDEVHMMTQSAFNALLKTLEEPPTNVIFILATTEPHKVIPTILSRCQRYNFSKVSDKDITDRLKTVLRLEGITYDEEALKLLVSLADGGVRDALSMLDQVLAYSDQKFRLNDVLNLFALTSKADQLSLIQNLSQKNVEQIFLKLNTLLDNGVDVRRLTTDLLNILKDALIYHRTHRDDLLVYLRQNEVQSLTDFIDVTELNIMIDYLLKAQADFRFANDIKNIFEIALLKIISYRAKNEEEVRENVTEVVKKPVPEYKEKADVKKDVIPPKQEAEETSDLPPFLKEEPVKTKEEPREKIKEPTQEKPLPSKPIIKNLILKEGTPIILEDELLIKVLTLADRDEKMKLKNESWDNLELLSMDSERGDYAALLYNGLPYALSNDILLMEFNFGRNATFVNLKENQPMIQAIIQELLGRKIPVYGLTHEQAVNLTRKYRTLSQVQKLPKVKNIEKELEGKF